MGRDKPLARGANKKDWYCQAVLDSGAACGKKADDKSELDPTGRLECGDVDQHAEGQPRSWWAGSAPPPGGWDAAGQPQARKTTKRKARR